MQTEEEFTKKVESDFLEREMIFKEAEKIAELFKGKSVAISIKIIDMAASIIKEKSIFS